MNRITTVKNYLFTLTIITFAQIFALLAFSCVIVFLHSTKQLPSSPELTGIYQKVIPVIAIISLSIGYYIFKNTTSKISTLTSRKDKLMKYQSAYIVRSALLELPGFAGAVATFITGALYFLFVPLLVAFLFVLLRPTAQAIAGDINLTTEERALFQDSNATLFGE